MRYPISARRTTTASFPSQLCNTRAYLTTLWSDTCMSHRSALGRISRGRQGRAGRAAIWQFPRCGCHPCGAGMPPNPQRPSPRHTRARPGPGAVSPFPSQVRSAPQHLPGKEPSPPVGCRRLQIRARAQPGRHTRPQRGTESLFSPRAALGEVAAPQGKAR